MRCYEPCPVSLNFLDCSAYYLEPQVLSSKALSPKSVSKRVALPTVSASSKSLPPWNEGQRQADHQGKPGSAQCGEAHRSDGLMQKHIALEWTGDGPGLALMKQLCSKSNCRRERALVQAVPNYIRRHPPGASRIRGRHRRGLMRCRRETWPTHHGCDSSQRFRTASLAQLFPPAPAATRV